MRATVLYYSHRGKTAQYARDIAMYLWSKGWHVSLCALSEYDPQKLRGTDLLCLGCWTSGWFIVHQHPHAVWKKKAAALPVDALPPTIVFFTTYKFRTGSMFRHMRKAMKLPKMRIKATLQSKIGVLSAEDKQLLDAVILQQSPIK